MVAKKKVELNVVFPDQKSKTAIFKAIAALAGVDEVKMEEGKVTVIGGVDPAKLSSEIKKVGIKEGCFGYKKGGREIYVEIATVGKPPEKPKCTTCCKDLCQKCCKCHNPNCKDCFKCCGQCGKSHNPNCQECFKCCGQNTKTCCSNSTVSSCNPHQPCCSSCSSSHQPCIPPYSHYRSYPIAQVVDYPTCYHDGYGGGCSIL